MNALLVSLLVATSPTTATALASEERPAVVVTTNVANWLIGYPGLEVEIPLGDRYAVYGSGSVFISQMDLLAPMQILPWIPGATLELGARAYPLGGSWGWFLDGHVAGTYLLPSGLLGPSPSTPRSSPIFSVGGTIGYRGHVGSLVLLAGVGADVPIIPGRPEPMIVPSLRLGIGFDL